MAGYVMTARRRAALKKAQLASARKRRKNKRITRKVSKVKRRAKKRINRQAEIVQMHYATANQAGAPVHYFTRRGAKAYNKGVRIHNRAQHKINRLNAKKRR